MGIDAIIAKIREFFESIFAILFGEPATKYDE